MSCDDFRRRQEWKIGDAAQTEYARLAAMNGACVLPIYGMDEVDARTKAPVMFTGRDLLVVPDVLMFLDGHVQWREVKAKTQASWRRLPPGPRYEHAIDYVLYEEYLEIERRTAAPVGIVICELSVPEDPNRESRMIPSQNWLYIPLSRLVAVGQHRANWPGSKRNKGGWFWARNEMRSVFK